MQYTQSKFTNPTLRKRHCPLGFALIATISVMVLLVMIALAMLSLSTIELRQSVHGKHQQSAKANARMALMIAIGELQKYAGPDQRVTARAAILEDPFDGSVLANRNWLGVWKTTFESNDKEWPLIGKAPDQGTSPYPHKGIYSDLRETEVSLKGDTEGEEGEEKWKDSLLQGWLVSQNAVDIDPADVLDDQDPDADVVEMLGRGTLGDDSNAAEYEKNRVLVQTVDVDSEGNKGAYAWYISDNNQKASIGLDPDEVNDEDVSFLASQADNPTSIESQSGGKPYASYMASAKGNYGKIITDKSAGLVENSDVLRSALGADFHHLTTQGAGLFTDVVMGGMKKDLSPLMFGNQSEEIVSFVSPGATVSAHDFSSDTPIIPGPRHAVLGPSFGAIRYWGRMKYEIDSDKSIDAQVEHKDISSTHRRISDGWNKARINFMMQREWSDGRTYDAGQWASKAPKVHPVMTDVRWHYYFGYSDVGGLKKIRTHIQPRVCLWNPYNVTMKTPQLMVLMTNPWDRGNVWRFQVRDTEIERICGNLSIDKMVVGGAPGEYLRIGNRGGTLGTTLMPSTTWQEYVSGPRYSQFTNQVYLGFVIEPSTFAPGECLVFSPKESGTKKYDVDNIGANVLSAKVLQGENNFYHDFDGNYKVLVDGGVKARQLSLTPEFIRELNFEEIIQYWTRGPMDGESWPFFLKAVNGTTDINVVDVTSPAQRKYPTLQLLSNGTGGPASYAWWIEYFGSSRDFESPFDDEDGLRRYKDRPDRQGSRAHQWGAKLSWLDESLAEAANPPFRTGLWTPEQGHAAFNSAPIANWNVRPSLALRSPTSLCDGGWFRYTSGAWMLQLNPFSPGDVERAPVMNDAGYFVKSPLGRSVQFEEPRAVMFDLPHSEYGALSLGALRHVQLSPYSWHPSYILGHSLVDLHAPFDTSAHLSMAGEYTGIMHSSWDDVVGGHRHKDYSFTHGPKLSWPFPIKRSDCRGLLQIGSEATTRNVEGVAMSSKDEVLPYDIAFEVNQNLWDGYYISGIPVASDGSGFAWDPAQGDKLWNARYQYNSAANYNQKDAVDKLNGSDAFSFAFWNSAYLLRNRGSFNVNSTSVEAWTAFLSGLQGIQRNSMTGDPIGGGLDSVFARVFTPIDGVTTNQLQSVKEKESWAGGSIVSEDEIKLLAVEIVKQVKIRGPFVSMADFVNRRLAPEITDSSSSEPEPELKPNPSSLRGAIEEALSNTPLNAAYEKAPFLTSSNAMYDENHEDWKLDVDKQPKSKAWGIPGYITQSDILEPIASSITVRGDSFTIRSYGESRDAKGDVKARAFLEAVVIRSPEYVQPANLDSVNVSAGANKAIDPALIVERSTGALLTGGLSENNLKFGRRFKIEAFRWLSPDEV